MTQIDERGIQNITAYFVGKYKRFAARKWLNNLTFHTDFT